MYNDEEQTRLQDALAQNELAAFELRKYAGDPQSSRREIGLGAISLNGAGIVGTVTLLTVSGFPTKPVGLALVCYFLALVMSLGARWLEVSVPLIVHLITNRSHTARQESLRLATITETTEKDYAARRRMNRRLNLDNRLIRVWTWLYTLSTLISVIATLLFLASTALLANAAWAFANR